MKGIRDVILKSREGCIYGDVNIFSPTVTRDNRQKLSVFFVIPMNLLSLDYDAWQK